MIRSTAPRQHAGVIACTVVSGVGLLLLLVGGRELLGELAHDDRPHTVGPLVPGIIAIAIGTAAVAMAGALQVELRWLMAYLVERETVRGVVDAASSVPLAELETPELQDHLQRTLQQSTHRPWEIVEAVTQLTGAVVGGAVVAAVLATVEPWLVPAMLLAGVPVLVVAGRNSRAMFDAVAAITPLNREREYLQKVLTSRDEAKEIRALEATAHLRERYADRYAEEIAALRRLSRLRARRVLLAGLASTLITTAVLVLLVIASVRGRLTLADVAVGAVAVQQLGARLRGFGTSVSAIQEAALFLDDHADFISRAQTSTGSSRPAPRTHARSSDLGAVSLDDVWFTYPGGAEPVLRGVDLTLQRGQVTALVGANGSGKTTIAKLVCRLYEPQSGRVSWDQSLVGDPSGPRIGVIFQDFVRYQLTARDNISLGNTARVGDDAGIRSSAEAAGAARFLSALPAGLDTWLVPTTEGGTDLSQGQWQRVALARALFRDAPVVVLDEPTAALDAASERALVDSTAELFADRAVLVISHRFANVVNADRIVVLDEGRVVESGTHRELLAAGGTYARMLATQVATLGAGDVD